MIKKLTAALFAGPPSTDWLAEYLLEKIMEVKKFSNGGFVQNEKKSNNLKVVHCGCSLVSRSQYEKYGAELLRKINRTPSAELI